MNQNRRSPRLTPRVQFARSAAPPCLLAFAMVWLSGCSVINETFTLAPPPPVGPGATEADLRPWLAGAQTVVFSGRLENINVASQWGSFVTWSVAPAGPWAGAEVDTRACPDAARRLNNCDVSIRGHLIERGDRHLPLLVADRIAPRGTIPCPEADQPPTTLAASTPSQ